MELVGVIDGLQGDYPALKSVNNRHKPEAFGPREK